MSVTTYSATRPSTVLIEPRPGGLSSDVWLRRNVEKDEADNGFDDERAVEFYRADEVHFVQAGLPTADEIEAAFDELWAAHEDDGLGDPERIALLGEAIEQQAAALLELGDLIGGE